MCRSMERSVLFRAVHGTLTHRAFDATFCSLAAVGAIAVPNQLLTKKLVLGVVFCLVFLGAVERVPA